MSNYEKLTQKKRTGFGALSLYFDLIVYLLSSSKITIYENQLVMISWYK